MHWYTNGQFVQRLPLRVSWFVWRLSLLRVNTDILLSRHDQAGVDSVELFHCSLDSSGVCKKLVCCTEFI